LVLKYNNNLAILTKRKENFRHIKNSQHFWTIANWQIIVHKKHIVLIPSFCLIRTSALAVVKYDALIAYIYFEELVKHYP